MSKFTQMCHVTNDVYKRAARSQVAATWAHALQPALHTQHGRGLSQGQALSVPRNLPAAAALPCPVPSAHGTLRRGSSRRTRQPPPIAECAQASALWVGDVTLSAGQRRGAP